MLFLELPHMKKNLSLLLGVSAAFCFLLFLLVRFLLFAPVGVSIHPERRAPAEDARIDLNLATVSELEQLKGIGPVTGEAIVRWREEHGAFQSVEDLLEVPGIGEKTVSAVRDYVYIGGAYEDPGSG